jgi:hypothetical protein
MDVGSTIEFVQTSPLKGLSVAGQAQAAKRERPRLRRVRITRRPV